MKYGRNRPCPCGSGKKFKHCCVSSDKIRGVVTPTLNLPLRIPPSSTPPSKEDYKSEPDDGYEDDFEDDHEDDFDVAESMLSALKRILVDSHKYALKNKPHIKEYKKLRKIHTDILENMVQRLSDGKFSLEIDRDFMKKYPLSMDESRPVKLISVEFAPDEDGEEAFWEYNIYKMAPNTISMTDSYIASKRFRKPEKIEFLHSMAASRRGLFEVVDVDGDNGYVFLKDVFTDDLLKVTDIAMSVNPDDFSDYYISRRIITHKDISFGSNLTFTFKKSSSFIKDFISEHKKNYNPDIEMVRFIELYKQYCGDENRIRHIRHNI